MKTIYRTSGVPWDLFFSKRFRFPQGTIIDYRFTDTRIPMRLNLRKFFTAARRIRSFRQSLTVAQNWGSEILSRFKFRENILNIAPNVLYFRTIDYFLENSRLTSTGFELGSSNVNECPNFWKNNLFN